MANFYDLIRSPSPSEEPLPAEHPARRYGMTTFEQFETFRLEEDLRLNCAVRGLRFCIEKRREQMGLISISDETQSLFPYTDWSTFEGLGGISGAMKIICSRFDMMELFLDDNYLNSDEERILARKKITELDELSIVARDAMEWIVGYQDGFNIHYMNLLLEEFNVRKNKIIDLVGPGSPGRKTKYKEYLPAMAASLKSGKYTKLSDCARDALLGKLGIGRIRGDIKRATSILIDHFKETYPDAEATKAHKAQNARRGRPPGAME
jgi:hypothetical protein